MQECVGASVAAAVGADITVVEEENAVDETNVTDLNKFNLC